MMSDTLSSSTPRPRPPAKSRRLPSVQFPKFPPPSYAASLDQVVFDAANTPEASFGLDDLQPSLLAHDSEDRVKEKSREELSELLLKAEKLIKSRESELSLTSTLCRNLYQDNVELKSKHETLLSRLPASPSPTAPTSPTAVTPHRILSPPYPESSFPRSSEYGDVSLPAPPARHMRRISVSPSDLASLADQNAELLDKLEKIESESAKADQAGKRKLQKLEREIQLLRQELEETQTKEAELEQARVAVAVSEEEAQRRKEEREERVRVFREKAGSSVSSSDTAVDSEEVRDFAPPSHLPRSGSLGLSPPAVPLTIPPVQKHSERPLRPILDPPELGPLPVSYSRPRFLSTRTPSVAESAIVSQLLQKIRELEETNVQITKDQQLTEERLRSAQWDAESIRRVYDCLGGVDGVELEVVADDDPEESPSKMRPMSSGGTISFGSLRRSIHQDISKLLEFEEPDAFARGISVDMRSTVRSPAGQKHVGSHKARKSVVGFFDSGLQALESPSEDHSSIFSPAARMASPAIASELGDLSTWSTAATDGMVPLLPICGSGLQTPFPGTVGRTLGSELGSECGDDWGENAGNYHFRTTSLYGISGLDLSREMSMSPQFVFPSPDNSGEVEPAPPRDDRGAEAGPSTPQRGPALQLTIEPPTPTPEKSVPEPPTSTRQQRLSHTMRSRTNRWVEGRFRPSSPSGSSAAVRRLPQTTGTRPGLDSELTMDETFGEFAQQFSQKQMGAKKRIPALRDDDFGINTAEPEADGATKGDAQDPDTSAVQLRADTSRIAGSVPQGRITRFVFEAWLWLQFGVVVMVFLYAMARRGPKSVLEEADRRRARSASGRR